MSLARDSWRALPSEPRGLASPREVELLGHAPEVDGSLDEAFRVAVPAVGGAMSKLWTTEMQGRVVDTCVQLHGGYGFMAEYEIAHHYTDSRVQRIYGGTSEIMKELIGRTL